MVAALVAATAKRDRASEDATWLSSGGRGFGRLASWFNAA
jgi:hypothetical protein